MEKPQPSKKIINLSPQEFETLIDDFHHGYADKWTPHSLSILELSLSSLLKPSFPLSLKLRILLFLDYRFSLLLPDDDAAAAGEFLSKLLQTLKTLIQSPIDNLNVTFSLKEQFLVAATSILMSIVDVHRIRVRLWGKYAEELVEVLLAIINRPNHGVDRQIRALACECLRELETEFPGLLVEIVGHLWGICQYERTHACQSYLLLLLEVIHNVVVCRLNVASVFSTALPLVPFNIPSSLLLSSFGVDNCGGNDDNVGLSGESSKELRRVVSFLLEWAQAFTPCGMVEFISRVMPLAVGLELQSSLLKVQFGGLMYNYDPLLWHVVLTLSRWFPDMYDGQGSEICRRLVLISKEQQQPLVFRLLVLHWLLGFVGLASEKDSTKKKLTGRLEANLYPRVYDALALKAMKLDLLAYSSILGDSGSSQDVSVHSVVTCLKDGLVCVEAYKWLPPWSTETAVAFRTLHKFLIGASPHFDTDLSVIKRIMGSPIFRSIKNRTIPNQDPILPSSFQPHHTNTHSLTTTPPTSSPITSKPPLPRLSPLTSPSSPTSPPSKPPPHFPFTQFLCNETGEVSCELKNSCKTTTNIAIRNSRFLVIGMGFVSCELKNSIAAVMLWNFFFVIGGEWCRGVAGVRRRCGGRFDGGVTMLVALLLDHQKLVPMVVALIDRLLNCEKHFWVGQKLLQTINEHLIPKIGINYGLSSYFLLFERIGKNYTIPPHRLLELLMKFTSFLVEKHGPNAGLKSWSKGSKILSVCRTMLLHHHSSRLFMGLSRLLAFTSLYFPDLEVRDNARIYLRMLICIPGKKLRHILNLGDQLIGLSPSPHFNAQPHLPQDPKKSRSISSYIYLERVIPLLVKQSWSLALPSLAYEVDEEGFVDAIKDDKSKSNGKDTDGKNAIECIPEARIDHSQEPLRVMDTKISEIVDILRKHFSCIPDFRHMPGLKIRIHCTLRFKSEPFSRVWGLDSLQVGATELDDHPAMYGIVIKLSSSAPYGSIPSCHIPILLGESSSDGSLLGQDSKDIVPVGTPYSDKSLSGTRVTVELEPREPVPGLVDVSLDANAENGQVINGKLQGVPVGIEDMFLTAPLPVEIPEETRPEYKSRLFDALWEVCGAASNSGRETFSMKGGKGFAAIYGTQSVKLLEVPPTFAIRVVERHLAQFVISVIGAPLVDHVKDGGFIKSVVWIDGFPVTSDASNSVSDSDGGPLYLTYFGNEDEKDSMVNIGKSNMGCFIVLIFLPPRYHLLFRMEVSDNSTLVRIRTDYWPCLAYVDDYLEALFSS
ncbi:hypothetical protein KSS87_000926 [Heliosperma pusillum]|nr:hypothetical protein KSS87_000926 [Heliosperma pusillum]